VCLYFEIEEASTLGSNCDQVDFHPIEVMMFRDRILTFKQLEGERIHESWLRFEALPVRLPTHEIPDVVLLECFYKSLGPGNKVLVDQLIPIGIAQQPYVIEAQLRDHMAERNQ